jgi:hypothetical protein
MTFADLNRVLFEIWRNAANSNARMQTVTLLGSPGIGKTSAARELARMMTEHRRKSDPEAPEALCEVLDLSSRVPEDLMGLPYTVDVTAEDGMVRRETRYASQRWLTNICKKDAYGVVVFDDLPAATTAIQVASRQASLERRIDEHRFAPGIMVLVTGNRREDKSAASTLPAHFRNSVLLLTVDPDFKRWETWYHNQGLDPLIGQFLTYRPAHFSRLPGDADSQGAFATPRTWEMLGHLVPIGRKLNTLRDLAAGLVGEGVATELVAFEMVRNSLVPPDRVLADPRGALPDPAATLDSPDKRIAMVTGLADAAIARDKEFSQDKNLVYKAYTEYLVALAHITASIGREYVNTSITTFTSHDGDFKKFKTVVQQLKLHADVRGMLQALAECF